MENVVSPKGQEKDQGTGPGDPAKAPRGPARSARDGFGFSRRFFENRFVYSVVSQRAKGLSIGVNLNPDKSCTFDCLYCEVGRNGTIHHGEVDLNVLASELRQMLILAFAGRMQELPGYQTLPRDLLTLKSVALSGDGEPTLSPSFHDAVQTIVHLRAQGEFPFFKIVLITNGTGLHLPQVQLGLQLFTCQDEIWTKLDAGTQTYMDRINRPLPGPADVKVSLRAILENTLRIGRLRPIVIQSLFALIDGNEPPSEEIEEYVQRLRELKQGGAQITLVQVYSAHRPSVLGSTSHLPLKSLSKIAQQVREITGLRAEVF